MEDIYFVDNLVLVNSHLISKRETFLGIKTNKQKETRLKINKNRTNFLRVYGFLQLNFVSMTKRCTHLSEHNHSI